MLEGRFEDLGSGEFDNGVSKVSSCGSGQGGCLFGRAFGVTSFFSPGGMGNVG